MKSAAALIIFFAAICGAYGICVFNLDDASKECAQNYGYNKDQVFRHYYSGYSSNEAPTFNLFVECVWRKWDFLTGDSDINYDAIRSTRIQPILITGVCDDVGRSPKDRNPFIDAVDRCQRESPADIRAETIRFCIALRYKEKLSN